MISGAKTPFIEQAMAKEAVNNLAAVALGVTPDGTNPQTRKRQEVEWEGGDSIRYFVPELWPEPVDTAAIIDEALAVIRSHVSIPDREALVVALWALHTHALDAFDVTPRLLITSAQPRSGKTSMLTALTCLVARPLDLCAGNTKGILECLGYHPTLLIDDAPDLLRSAAAIIRNGRQRIGAKLVSYSSQMGLGTTSLFTPIAAAVEGKAPPVFSGRSIEMRIERLPRGQVFRRQTTYDPNLDKLPRKLARWAEERTGFLRDREWPQHAEQDDNWLPLIAIAADAGPEWEAKARAAMDHIRVQSGPTPLEMLLADIRTVMTDDRIRSADLAKLLAELEERPWGEWGKTGRPITTHKIASLLAQVNVRPRTLRFHTENGSGFNDKGYLYAQFATAFESYLGKPGATDAA